MKRVVVSIIVGAGIPFLLTVLYLIKLINPPISVLLLLAWILFISIPGNPIWGLVDKLAPNRQPLDERQMISFVLVEAEAKRLQSELRPREKRPLQTTHGRLFLFKALTGVTYVVPHSPKDEALAKELAEILGTTTLHVGCSWWLSSSTLFLEISTFLP